MLFQGFSNIFTFYYFCFPKIVLQKRFRTFDLRECHFPTEIQPYLLKYFHYVSLVAIFPTILNQNIAITAYGYFPSAWHVVNFIKTHFSVVGAL